MACENKGINMQNNLKRLLSDSEHLDSEQDSLLFFPLVVVVGLFQTSEDPSSFWLLGKSDIRYQNDVGDCEFKWMREYCTTWRWAGCFGVSVSCSVTVLRFVTE